MQIKEGPKPQTILFICVIALLLAISSSFWKSYVSGRLILKNNEVVIKTKICVITKQKKICSLTNRYGRFYIKLDGKKTDTIKIIVPDYLKNEMELKYKNKKILGFSYIYALGDIILK
jgi:hypothetical protein